jgi:Membrane bound beta barrel domain (DUF5777)
LNAIAASLMVVLFPALLLAQDAPATPPPVQADPDVRLDPLQPDFNLAALPTTLRLPRGKWAFRITHRFTRPLGQGNFGDLLADAFGFDGSAQIGLEVRYGLMRGTQLGVHRTSDRSIQFFGQHNLMNERDGRPIGLDALATIEGIDNFQDRYQSALGVLVSKNLDKYAAVYLEPIVMINANAFDDPGGDEHTMMLGIGGRVRIRPSWYVVAEITPRLAGYDPGSSQASVGVEGRAGGHLFQVNFSNGFGTTYGQIARGAFDYDNWYIGFNISRKFF